MMTFQLPIILLLAFSWIIPARTTIGDWEACGGRLERALDTLHKDSSRRNRLKEEEADLFYQQELRSAPLEMSVSRITVKLPQGARDVGNQWARVEKCVYEPNNNSLQTRVMFNDLSVTGLVSLMPRDHQPPILAESCRMTLRLRRAGVDFLTSPIARGRGQMRIRTESSFLEPRFASIYAYGCHPTRLDKQIKRQDKWPPLHPPRDEYTLLPVTHGDEYEAAEPRQLIGVSKEVDVVIPNETRQSRFLSSPVAKLGIWRKNVWLTKPSSQEREALAESSVLKNAPLSILRFPGSFESSQEASDRSIRILRSVETIASHDFASSLTKRPTDNESGNCTARANNLNNVTEISLKNLNDSETKSNFKRENTYPFTRNDDPKETRHVYVDEALDNIFPVDIENDSRSWQSKEHIAREMEDVFLRGASQALTRYIEKQLHPAIKETLMISMGYTISYG
ncbi:uncharacterized protein LOC100882072 [Megachile rotundata]|uniref:uncharacterized protein LOC100882072 n=1 Tax=Megachile rotundata TaxID=143995 RepID=UPI000258E1AA|nr:PREDICTED: uncharacterized protein LOC100882072 [Megachile rotundata]XP_012139396.1 PREDICTED: uncharacterized protein LOC100882072 [Megachile rotundata]XP_012139397.1 PREDICTED: uncharacterized protein LOC100882072 [Megachile rotundata]